MKKLTVLAYCGLLFLILGAIPIGTWTAETFSMSVKDRIIDLNAIGAFLGALLSSLGTLLALIGGVTRRRFLWIALIIAGFLFLVPFFASFFSPYAINIQELRRQDIFRDQWPQNLWFILPGAICILEGIVLRVTEISSRNSKRSTTPSNY
jgi:hypothetical protein